MKKYIIILISIILDGLIPNITLYRFNNITYFTPICTAISLIFVYEEDKSFYKLLLGTILIYGTLYINNLILSSVVFLITSVIIKIFKKYFKDNLFTILIQILLIIFFWDMMFFIVNSLIITNVFIWENYLYKVSHTLVFNILYGGVLFKICNKKRSKLNH